MKRETKGWIVTIVLLILIGFVFYNQIRIISLISQYHEELNQDPLMFAAKRYGIQNCTCYISPEKSIDFGEQYSKTIIKPKLNSPLN